MLRTRYVEIGGESIPLTFTMRALRGICEYCGGETARLNDWLTSDSEKNMMFGKLCCITAELTNGHKTAEWFTENIPFSDVTEWRLYVLNVINLGFSHYNPSGDIHKEDAELAELEALRKKKRGGNDGYPDVEFFRLVSLALRIGLDYNTALALCLGEIIQLTLFAFSKE